MGRDYSKKQNRSILIRSFVETIGPQYLSLQQGVNLMKLTSILFSAALLMTSTAFAASSPLVGTWALEKSENPMPDGSVVSYCTGVHGFIIYTEEGYVSVALNCAPQGNGSEPADISGRKFFYTGTYQYDGNT